MNKQKGALVLVVASLLSLALGACSPGNEKGAVETNQKQEISPSAAPKKIGPEAASFVEGLVKSACATSETPRAPYPYSTTFISAKPGLDNGGAFFTHPKLVSILTMDDAAPRVRERVLANYCVELRFGTAEGAASSPSKDLTPAWSSSIRVRRHLSNSDLRIVSWGRGPSRPFALIDYAKNHGYDVMLRPNMRSVLVDGSSLYGNTVFFVRVVADGRIMAPLRVELRDASRAGGLSFRLRPVAVP